jgi:hypothetical protein
MWRFNTLDLCLWGWTKSKVYKRKMGTRKELLARILDAAARIKNVNINPEEQQAILAHEL